MMHTRRPSNDGMNIDVARFAEAMLIPMRRKKQAVILLAFAVMGSIASGVGYYFAAKPPLRAWREVPHSERLAIKSEAYARFPYLQERWTETDWYPVAEWLANDKQVVATNVRAVFDVREKRTLESLED